MTHWLGPVWIAMIPVVYFIVMSVAHAETRGDRRIVITCSLFWPVTVVCVLAGCLFSLGREWFNDETPLEK